MSTQVLDRPRADVPGLRPVTGLVLVLALLLLGAAGLMAHDYATYTGDDPLIGLAALAAVACATPAALGLVLVGAAWLGRRRVPRVAAASAYLALVVVLAPVGLVALMWVGSSTPL